MRYPLGQPVRLTTTVRDAAGTLVDPGAISLILQRPDLTTATYDLGTAPAVVKDSTGTYHLDFTAGQLGRHQLYWLTTGTAAGATPASGFDVTDPFSPAHISYDDALEQLELTAATLSPGRQAELQRMVASAISEQERWVGAVAPRQVTETITARAGRLWPRVRPVLSVTSATLGGVGETVAGWTVGDGDLITAPAVLAGVYAVTYVAGRSPAPPDLVEAALLRVQHSYATQRGGSPGLSQVIGEAAVAGFGAVGSDFLLMLRARDKERPYDLPVIA